MPVRGSAGPRDFESSSFKISGSVFYGLESCYYAAVYFLLLFSFFSALSSLPFLLSYYYILSLINFTCSNKLTLFFISKLLSST